MKYLPGVVNFVEQLRSALEDRGVRGPHDALAVIGHGLDPRERLDDSESPLLGLFTFN
jgi:hypothetical protein